MTTWLHSKRKQDLTALADEAGLKGTSSMRKDELVEALDKHLTANASTLSSKPSFDPYFVKSEPSALVSNVEAAEAKVVKAKRRVTKVASELQAEASSGASSLVARTPKTVQKAAASIPLPPSPSVVTDLVERQTSRFTSSVSQQFDKLGVTTYAESTREALSTVISIQTLFLALEGYGLLRAVLPWRYAFDLPGLGVTNPLAISLPDVFVFLTSEYWGTTSLWLLTSVILPSTTAWFINLTVHSTKRNARYTVDPLVFSITKAAIAWIVYGHQFSFIGLINPVTALRVDAAVPGGWFGIVVGSLIGVVASLYEVVLRK